MNSTPLPTIVLAGMESAGKSALFRGLTGRASGDEANFRGSTVVCRRCHVPDCSCDVVDTPGIRLQADALTTQLALSATTQADVVLLVARGTDARSEVEILLRELDLKRQRSALAITFKDRAPSEIEALAAHYRQHLQIPVVLINARNLDAIGRQEVLRAIDNAAPLHPASYHSGSITPLPPAPTITRVAPAKTWLELPLLGSWLALGCMAVMFALPVYLAYLLAQWAQPFADSWAIQPISAAVSTWPDYLQAMLTGGYGLLTLGTYSFIWAFPVVVLLAGSVAITEESGLKDRITAALDPWLRRIGLNGRDLVPVLTGFGCNVVAVFQSRACSACTRKSCVSLISFGSACSYQIGASLSIFSAAGHPSLFAPYLAALFLAGALHTRLWHGSLSRAQAQPMQQRAFLQRPSLCATAWRMRATISQFLSQAMPIFLLICITAALLQYLGILTKLETFLAPLMSWLNLPPQAAAAILFSILRKDGLLMLNQHDANGDIALLATMSSAQVFLTVWLASTFTACLVTLWTIRKELGWPFALKMATRQAITSVFSSLPIAYCL